MKLTPSERAMVVQSLQGAPTHDETEREVRDALATRIQASAMQEAMEDLVRELRESTDRQTIEGLTKTLDSLAGLASGLASCLGSMLVLITDTEVASEAVVRDGREALRMWHEVETAVRRLVGTASGDIPF